MRTILDPSYPDIDTSVFHDCNWRLYYGDRNKEKKLIYDFMWIPIMLARRKLNNQEWDSLFS